MYIDGSKQPAQRIPAPLSCKLALIYGVDEGGTGVGASEVVCVCVREREREILDNV